MVSFANIKAVNIWIWIFKIVLQIWNMCEWASKVPKNSIFQEKPQPGILLPNHQGGVNGYEHNFDWRQLVWPWTASWPQHKQHSDNTEVLTISKLWHGFKVSTILADLCHKHINRKSRILIKRFKLLLCF